MNDSILCAEINRLRTELAASKARETADSEQIAGLLRDLEGIPRIQELMAELAASERVAARLEEQRAAEAEKARRWQAKWLEMRKVEHELSDAYLRLRRKLNAIQTPTTMPAEQMWAYTEGKLDELIGRVREMEVLYTAMRQALEWAAHAIDAAGLGSADDLDLLDDALATDAGKAMLEQRAKAEERVRELEGQLTDASRVCDTPGCLAAVVRRDDGSRICAAGHNSRWVDSVELIRARGVNEELERQLVASWNVRDAQGKEITEAQASCAGMKEALEAWQKAEGLEIELGQCGRTDRAYHEAQQQRDKALATDAGKAMLEQRAAAEERVRELERLRAFDTSTVPLPKGLMLEYHRLDDLWQRMVKERIEMKTRVREMEADCAAMRQALDDIMTNANGKWMWPSNHARKALLATDAGKAMLERMAKQEGAVAEMRTVLEQCFDYLTMLSFVDFWDKWGIGVKATTWGTADKFVATNITKALAIKEAPDV